MARSLRAIPPEVARQALINKTLNASQLEAAARGPRAPGVSEKDVELLAANVAVPELLPYEYAYVDVLTDGRGNFYLGINHTFYRRSGVQRLGLA